LASVHHHETTYLHLGPRHVCCPLLGLPATLSQPLACHRKTQAGVRLYPRREHRHRPLALWGGNEEGFYVALMISSGPGRNDEQFTRMVIAQQAGGTVYTFRRRGHFERPPTAKSNQMPTQKPLVAGEHSSRIDPRRIEPAESKTQRHGDES
jgi:hypothetical protein